MISQNFFGTANLNDQLFSQELMLQEYKSESFVFSENDNSFLNTPLDNSVIFENKERGADQDLFEEI